MAKGGKLMKLKSVLKKFNSFNKQTVTRHQDRESSLSSATSSFSSSSSAELHPVYVGKSVLKKLNSFNNQTVTRHQDRESSLSSATSSFSSSSSAELHPVYVGKSRRRYLVSSDVIDHPIFRELADRSSGGDDTPSVACEVVLFEHLLWMLENADTQPESIDEIVDFYTC